MICATLAAMDAGAVVGVAVVDDDGRIARVDRHVEQITGLTAEALVGRAIAELVPGLAAGQQHELRFGATLATGARWLDGASVVVQGSSGRERERALGE
ncbi:MAG: PAS domain S-box protein, partial [Myxococcales bacterium]|nr:PAS domain S-box protein [Myxococcales bacterium]